jgi:methionyl-tRNA formyltransferase
MATRIVFMGSPDFALPSLRALAAQGEKKRNQYQIVGIVTQPDRPAGRGRKLTSPVVKQLANELGLPIIQPEKLNIPEAMEKLNEWSPDLIVVAAFGQILKPSMLELPKHGCINVHASLLPRWRGASPISAAILHGDLETGVTIMKMDEGMDSGPILSQCAIQLNILDTTGFLSETLSKIGADLLVKTLPGYLSGKITPQPQSEAGVTHAPAMKKKDGQLQLSDLAVNLVRRVHACNPWPGAAMDFEGEPLKIHRAHVENIAYAAAEPGSRIIVGGQPAVMTAEGAFVLDEVQRPGRKIIHGKDFISGRPKWISRSV